MPVAPPSVEFREFIGHIPAIARGFLQIAAFQEGIVSLFLALASLQLALASLLLALASLHEAIVSKQEPFVSLF